MNHEAKFMYHLRKLCTIFRRRFNRRMSQQNRKTSISVIFFCFLLGQNTGSLATECSHDLVGFLLKCTELEEAKTHRLMIAHKLRELQILNIENEFLFEKKQTDVR
jgi:hypothetical protein